MFEIKTLARGKHINLA